VYGSGQVIYTLMSDHVTKQDNLVPVTLCSGVHFQSTTYKQTTPVFTHSRRRGYCVQTRLSVCLSVCPRSNRKTARAINTILGTRILFNSRSACIDPEMKRSKVKVTVTKTVTVTRLLVTRAATAYAGVCVHVDSTAYVV